MIYNNSAKESFGSISTDSIMPDDRYPIWEKIDNFGRKYYGTAHFWNMDNNISADTELSWLEWDGNEVNISFADPDSTEAKYIEAISILKSWENQLKQYSDSKFCIIISYDNGDLLDEEDKSYSFTMRFWKEREGTEIITSVDDFYEPVMIEYCS